jgi:hypothetical protein
VQVYPRTLIESVTLVCLANAGQSLKNEVNPFNAYFYDPPYIIAGDKGPTSTGRNNHFKLHFATFHNLSSNLSLCSTYSKV